MPAICSPMKNATTSRKRQDTAGRVDQRAALTHASTHGTDIDVEPCPDQTSTDGKQNSLGAVKPTLAEPTHPHIMTASTGLRAE